MPPQSRSLRLELKGFVIPTGVVIMHVCTSFQSAYSALSDAVVEFAGENALTIKTRLVSYAADDMQFEGMMAWDDSLDRPLPGVLVSHTIRGRSAFEEDKARRLAEQGYAGFALDVYGKDRIAAGDEQAREDMMALRADRPQLQQRMHLSLQALAAQPEVDKKNIAAIGFCFGGLCVLDLARTGAPLRGVASFHGLLEPPGNTVGNTSGVAVLVLHGWDDPLALPDSVVALGAELTDLGCDWQIHAYGHTVHAFANPAANDNPRGTVYSPAADNRSWLSLINFLAELFG